MITAPIIKPPVSPDLRGSSPFIRIGVIVGVGSGVVCRALICLGRLNAVSTINANKSPIYITWRVFLDKGFIQGISLNIRGIIPKSFSIRRARFLDPQLIKKAQRTLGGFKAEGVGFEPTIPCGIRALQARALGRTMRPLHVLYTGAIIPNRRLTGN